MCRCNISCRSEALSEHPVHHSCAYIPYDRRLYSYISTSSHTCMGHAHACAAKQSELVRRCIATTALFAQGTSCCWPAGWIRLPVCRTILEWIQSYTWTRFGFVRGFVVDNCQLPRRFSADNARTEEQTTKRARDLPDKQFYNP